MRKRKAPQFKVGDRIAFSAGFLRSTGQTTGGAGEMRATVTKVSEHPVSDSAGHVISFRDDSGYEGGGLACNFTLVERLAIDSALNT